MVEEYVRKTIKLNTKLWEEFQNKIEKEYGANIVNLIFFCKKSKIFPKKSPQNKGFISR